MVSILNIGSMGVVTGAVGVLDAVLRESKGGSQR